MGRHCCTLPAVHDDPVWVCPDCRRAYRWHTNMTPDGLSGRWYPTTREVLGVDLTDWETHSAMRMAAAVAGMIGAVLFAIAVGLVVAAVMAWMR